MIDIFGDSSNKYFIAIVIFIAIQILRLILRSIVLKIVKKTKNKYDDELYEVLEKPLRYMFLILGGIFAKSVLLLDDEISLFLDSILRSFFIVVLFWGIIKVVTHLSDHIHKVTNKFGDKVSVEVANFMIKSIRFFLIILAAIAVLQEWGYNVSGFLASMGLVGMAFALAAKDTAANLFGSLVIFTDKPFEVGDWIKTPEVEGIIESIGIRSTQIRTFAQAQVTVPNATLANSAILNWSRMGKRRIKMNVGLTYQTKGETVKKIVDDIRSMLENHPDIHQDTIHIYFTTFNSSSLDIFCYYFTKTTNWGEYMAVQEDTNLKIMQIVEQNGSSFAYPTQTLFLNNEDNTVE